MATLLRRGSTRPAVRELQGNPCQSRVAVRVDGSFGPETEKAVRTFQARSRQPVDRIAGPRTREVLLGARTPRSGSDPFDPARWLDGLGRHPRLVERPRRRARHAAPAAARRAG